ncbi:MAG: CDP-glycerol glycerophosphotransferase family protein [Spirochaetaceae bacterium]|jgi:hypothetical protein|nr:CDP-glycerol glycerophosphotransferase family protein [Spirochaetaceae bacterium]
MHPFLSFFPDFFLYIDPGTGSMLFSIAIGAAAALYFLFRALLLKAKVFFAGGKSAGGAKNRFVIYAEDKRYWTLFKGVCDEIEGRGAEALYLTSSPDDPVFAAGYGRIKPELLGQGNRAFARLNFLSADFVLATTPGLDVFQWKRSKTVGHYCHILHATADATMYAPFGLDYFDSVLCTGDYQQEEIRALERLRGLPPKTLLTVGCPYLDWAQEKLRQDPSGADADAGKDGPVLVSPSWGPSGLLSRYGEKLLDPLLDSGLAVIVRPHPQSKISEAELLGRLTARYADRPNIEWDYSGDNTAAMSRASVMISDFSGIIFDFMFLFDRPVLYVNYELDLRRYDAHWLPEGSLWQTRAVQEAAVELREGDFGNIAQVIRDARTSPSLREARLTAKNTAWQRRGEAGKLTADFMFAQADKNTNTEA